MSQFTVMRPRIHRLAHNDDFRRPLDEVLACERVPGQSRASARFRPLISTAAMPRFGRDRGIAGRQRISANVASNSASFCPSHHLLNLIAPLN